MNHNVKEISKISTHFSDPSDLLKDVRVTKNKKGNCFWGSFFRKLMKKVAFANAIPYPKNWINTAPMERTPI